MSTRADISVLMSVYEKERPERLVECFESLLGQTVLANEWVLVEDGPLTDSLYSVIEDYESRHPGLIKTIPLEMNVGLGKALHVGIEECSNELIARMDTDDIASSNRFEVQLEMFASDPDLDICGSHVAEFEGSIENVVRVRRVPIEDADIKEYQKRRDSFNHPTVMYKKASVLRAGNYQHAPLMEDSLLWVNMIVSGAKCKNYDGCLVYMRTESDLYERRGGVDYFSKYKEGRKKIYETGFISKADYRWTLFAQLVVALAPNQIRKQLFTKVLRDGPGSTDGS